MAHARTPLMLAVLATLLASAAADCPDADVRCRIPISNIGSTVSESGCEGGVEAGGEVTEGIVTGSVTVSGSCFEVVTDSDSAEFVPVGTITMGQCFDLLQGGCQIANCNDTPGARCNQEVAACTVFGDPVCLATYTAAEGHNCFDIATAQGATLDALLSINPGLNCDPLSIGQSICTSFGEDSSAGQAVCKGFQI